MKHAKIALACLNRQFHDSPTSQRRTVLKWLLSLLVAKGDQVPVLEYLKFDL